MTDPGDVDLQRSPDDRDVESSSTRGPVPIVVGMLVVGLIAAGVLWWVRRAPSETPVATDPAAAVEPGAPPAPAAPPPPPGSPEEDEDTIDLPPLADSDTVARRLAGDLSAEPALGRWLSADDLVRRLVVVLDNVAEGGNPAQRLGFLRPDRRFRVLEQGDRLVLDPANYERYDTVARVVDSMDAAAVARVFRALAPLVQEAYDELGRPEVTLNQTVEQAIVTLLETPVVEGDVELVQRASFYEFADPALEDLEPIQKQLLGMGPENVRRVQARLREVAAALDVPASRLPGATTYRPTRGS